MSNYKIFHKTILSQNDRWLINSLLNSDVNNDTFKDVEMIALKDILKERKESLNPQENSDKSFNYLGLENIQPFTGFLVNYSQTLGQKIKSRCKIFKNGDLLFSRLRPTLNKTYIVDDELKEGICSTEFLVFKIDKTKINPTLLRFLLASEFVQSQIRNYVAGAALPRIQVKDFLSINIPLIDKKMQTELSLYLDDVDKEYKSYFNKLNDYERDINKLISTSINEKKLLPIV